MNHTSPSQSGFVTFATPELPESRACARRAEASLRLPSASDNETQKPNHALQVTAGLAVSFGGAAVRPPGSVTGCASAATFPPTVHSPRLRLAPPCSVSALSGPPHLSLGSLGFRSPVL